jgi:hypothetical protein
LDLPPKADIILDLENIVKHDGTLPVDRTFAYALLYLLKTSKG